MSNSGGSRKHTRAEMYRPNSRLEIFSTCPPIGNTPLAEYSKAVADAGRWSENWGCTGILVY